ncbi:hypothetical protein [Mycobacterium phage WXIN]|nr:hypothetical protein [Mycobacterium phage WXIN]
MSTATEVLPVNLADLEFETPCSMEGCGRTAEWMARVEHNHKHVAWEGLACDDCKTIGEQFWIEALKKGGMCTCRRPHKGQLSDNFRAIRL